MTQIEDAKGCGTLGPCRPHHHRNERDLHRFLPALVPQTLFSRRPYWAQRFGVAPFLPTTRAEMDELGWDSCDVILVTGDAYIDHPSFGMALVGRLLESHGLSRRHPRSARLAQRRGVRARSGGRTCIWGVTAGNMDSMVNRYTSDRKIRSRRRVLARRRRRAAPRSRGDRLRAALPRGVRRRAGRDRRHRGQPAPHRALRLLVRQGSPLGARRCARPICWSTATPSARSSRSRTASRRASRSSEIRDLRGTAFVRRAASGFARDRLDDARRARPRSSRSPDPYAMEPKRAQAAPPARPASDRADVSPSSSSCAPRKVDRARAGHPHAELRAGQRGSGALRARLAHPPPRGQPGQRARAGPAPRQARRLDQPAAAAADDARDGRALRAAVHAPAAPALRRREAPRLRDDQASR